MNGGYGLRSIVHAQSNAAMDGVADRLRAERPVEEEVGDPAIGNADHLILDHDRFADARLRVSGIDCKPCSPQIKEREMTPLRQFTS
jgi:hypothetical protein